MTDPVGIDATVPRLSWIVQSSQRGQRQTAYQILVASAPELLAQAKGDLWDSGKVASDETVHVSYGGKEHLRSRQACHWMVKVWDRDGKPSEWSTPARWEMGLLKPADWHAKWIAAKVPENTGTESLAGAKWIWCPERGVDLAKAAPAGDRFFRCRVDASAEKPSLASILISVDDQYTLFVNGRQIAHVDAPDGWRRPTRYDILPELKSGANVIAVAGKNLEAQAGVCAKITLQYTGKPPEDDRQ